jgi:hypothetical protein
MTVSPRATLAPREARQLLRVVSYRLAGDLGSGRIFVSEIEAPNMLANLA